MDVNEHERLSNITLKTQIKVKEQYLYCCSTFHRHSKVFNNKHNTYQQVLYGPIHGGSKVNTYVAEYFINLLWYVIDIF